MNEELIAARYAQGYFLVARDEGALEAARDVLHAFCNATAGEPDMLRYWANPTVETSEKCEMIERILDSSGVQGSLAKFLRLLVSKGRYSLIPYISTRFDILCRRSLKESTASVISAKTIAEEQLIEIKQVLEDKTDKKITLETELDPSLIGGVIVKMGDIVFDGSIKGRLERLQMQMSGRQS